MICRSACTFFLALILSMPAAFAEEGGRKGIAFVQAPEMSSGVCTGANAEEAFACARKQCVDGGGTDEDCVAMSYCFPALYSVQVSILHTEGLHWAEFYCGWASKEAALAAAKVACDRERRPDLAECAAVLLYDEDGKQEEVPQE